MNDLSNPIVPAAIWIGFNIFVIIMIVIDLVVIHRKSKTVSVKEALLTSLFWISLALIFNLGIWVYLGKASALDFLAGYLIEKSLSIDNLFVFLLIFNYFQTPKEYQHKVLFWGILGAILMRACFIFFGIALVQSFHWILYFFGIFLIYAGIKMALPKSEEIHPEDNVVIKILERWIPISHDYDKDHFFVKKANQWYATPLVVALITVETTDVIFAMDSIPAIMAITLDPFIVYTSNIFAILGLRALYFALAGLIPLFHFLHYALAAILGFVGLKMLIKPLVEIPIGWALGFIIVALLSAILASFLFPNEVTKERK